MIAIRRLFWLFSIPTATVSLLLMAASLGCQGIGPNTTGNPPPKTLSSLSVTPSSPSVGAGETQQFSATGTYSDSTTADVSATVTWTSASAAVATITATGLATAVQSGSSTITASLNGIKGTATLNVRTVTRSVTSIAVTPASSSILVGATQQLTATATYNDGTSGNVTTTATWKSGTPAVATINSSGLASGVASGSTTITASLSGIDGTATLSVSVSTISRGNVLTYHNDDARDGAFLEEVTLTPSKVNSTQFGKLFAYPVDGQVYAQPLYMSQVSIAGGTHSVVYVATQNNTVYAFDAGATAQTAQTFWKVHLAPPVPKHTAEGVNPQIGILSTPVIDPNTNTIYLVAEEFGQSTPFWLHALEVTTGAEKFGGPVPVTGTVAGTGLDSSGGTITLETSCYQRMGLALNPVTNAIYIAFGTCNHGWILAYDKNTLKQTAIFNDTPDGGGGGLWGGGGAPAIDDTTGDVYLMSGVDQDDPVDNGYNDSFLRLNPTDLSVQDYFTPDDNSILSGADADLGSGANILLPGSSTFPHETLGGGKDGNIFVVNRDSMGGYFPPPVDENKVIQTVHTGTKQYDNIFSTPVYWNGFVYFHPESDVLHAYSWSSGMLSSGPVSSGSTPFDAHGATASLSANGTVDGIIWEIDNTAYNGDNPSTSGPSVLHACDATNVATELYNSAQAGTRDKAGLALKFTVPTVVGGRVYLPTASELDVYGLLTP